MLSLGLYSQYGIYTKVVASGRVTISTLFSWDRLLWTNYSVYREAANVEQYLREMSARALHASPPKIEIPHNVVVIIGESQRRDYMHCYGYELDNTPNLDRLIKNDGLILFDRIMSPSTYTMLSLLHVLSNKKTNDEGHWSQFVYINQLLKKAGYTTSWLSNQESGGMVIPQQSIIASLSDSVVYTKTRSLDDDPDYIETAYDEALLPILDKARSYRDKKKSYFDILHLMGSHIAYRYRFPDAYRKFTAKDITRDLSEQEKTQVAEYANSIYYSDYVISRIIERYRNTPSIVFYFSDHGETLYDDPERPDYLGHGGKVVPQELRIPFMVYMSPSMREAYPELYEMVERAKERRIMTDTFPPSLLGLLGIESQYRDPKFEFFGDEYDNERKMMVATNDGLLPMPL